MAILLKADGAKVPVNEPLTLERMQALVGGYVEFVTLAALPARREVLIVNEDGLGRELPFNASATMLYRGSRVRPEGKIVGDAIWCVAKNEGTESEAYE